jgi:uncharacterized membrane protein AbrB (regulator of aidB expression)
MNVVVLLGLLSGASVGAALGRLARLPMWPLTGALIGAGAVHLAVGGGVALPAWLIFVAQVLVGSTLGARLGPTALREFRDVMAPGMVAVLATVLAGIALGLALWSERWWLRWRAWAGTAPWWPESTWSACSSWCR